MPVPSLFFIKNGIPIKIVTSVVKSADELITAIDEILKNETVQTSEIDTMKNESDTSSSSAAEAATGNSKEAEIVCEGDVCVKQPAEKQKEEIEEKIEEETEEEKQEKVKRALKLIEEKRIEKIKEDEKLEKEREIRRRKEGQEVQKLKIWQDDQELKQLKEDRQREKQEALEARRRVLAQIEEDKINRRSNQQETPSTKKPEPTEPKTPNNPPNSARIQFKKPDGESEIVTFDSSILFCDLHAFVKSDILNGSNISDFALATTFPRRQFSNENFDKSLIDLNLAPTSVLLIIPLKKTSSMLPTQSDGSLFDMLSALMLGLFSPVFAVFAYLKTIIASKIPQAGNSGNENNIPSDAGKRKRDEETLAANDA